MEQVVIQLQQKLFSLRAQVAAQVQITAAVQAINNLATAQVRKDTPSLVDVNGLGRPKKFSGKEEDFQQWSKKTEALFAGVIKESETMLEWAAEQTTEITTELLDREVLLSATNQERGVQNLEFTTLLPTRGRTHWRHGDDCRRDTILQQEEGSETFLFLGGQCAHEEHDEQVKRKTLEMEIKSLRVMSKGNRGDQERKWLRNQDESEWSLNTSLMLRFGSLFPDLAGRSLRRIFPL